MIGALLVALLMSLPAAAQDPPPPSDAVRACVDAAERASEAERACIGVEALACIDADPAAQTTVGMAACYAAERAAWDDLLNATYGDLLALSAGAEDHKGLLRDAQRAWIAFRDADCAEAAGVWGDGSMRQVAGAECMLDRTATRALELIEKRRGFESP